MGVAAGNLNGDGKVDLAVADDTDPGTVTLLFGTGTGRFTRRARPRSASTRLRSRSEISTTTTEPDLASVSGGFGHLDVNLNNGDGTFAANVNYATGFVANTVFVADLNEDAQAGPGDRVQVPVRGRHECPVGQPGRDLPDVKSYDPGGQTPETVAVADLNHDGHLDVVTANGRFDNNSVSVLLGDGGPRPGPPLRRRPARAGWPWATSTPTACRTW